MAGRKHRGAWKNDPNRQPKGGGDGVLRPPFEKDNDLAIKHGANSTRHWLPTAEGLAAGLVDVAPWTARPAFAATVASWAKAESQCQLLHAYLDHEGLLDENGDPRPATGLLTTCETRASNLRQQLGLTPVALAKLLQALAAVASSTGDATSLDAVRAEGRRIAQAYEELTS